MDERIPARQLAAWLFVATLPPLIQLTSGDSWLWLLVLGGGCLVLNWIRGRLMLPKWEYIPGVVLTVIVLGEFAARSAGSWPVGNSDPAVPLILLVLAAWSASKGAQAAVRAGAVLSLFVVLMYAFYFAAGLEQVRWEWLKPTGQMVEPLGLLVLLIPSATSIFPIKGTGGNGKRILGLCIAVGAVLLTQGVLSPKVATLLENPFYEMSRSLELLGVAQRFEALTCVTATVGWFALMTLLMSVNGKLIERIRPGWGCLGVWTSAIGAAGWYLCGLHISGWILTEIWAVFWVGFPLLTQGIGKIKKS